MGSRTKIVRQGQYILFPESLSEELEAGWDFTSEDTQYLSHALHPYLASMIPQIPRKLLGIYANPSTRVLDPFVGGGSVLVESYLANLKSTGIDVNPLAVIISKAKTTPILGEILVKALRTFDKIYPSMHTTIPSFPKTAKMEYWFKPYMFEPLAKIRATIQEVAVHVGGDRYESLKHLFACIFWIPSETFLSHIVGKLG